MKFKNLKEKFKINFELDKKIFGLDLMRCIAIFWVLHLHGNRILEEKFPNIPTFEFIDGVDIFFVLSGFLIGTILLKIYTKDRYDFSEIINFWKRRWFRTLPNYFLVLILILIYIYLTTGSFSDFNYKYLFFLQNIFKPQWELFPASWSLCIEEWFYFLFPLFVFIFYKSIFRSNKNNSLILVTFIFIIVPTLFRFKKAIIWQIIEIDPSGFFWKHHFRHLVATRLDAIMFGVIGAIVKFYYPKIWSFKPYIYFLIGCILLYITNNYFNSGYLYYVVYFNFMPLSIMFMLPFLDNLKNAPKIIAVPITFLSIISYSMYLIHESLVLNPILKFLKPENNIAYIGNYIFYYFITIGVSTLIYIFLRKKNDLFKREKTFQIKYPAAREGVLEESQLTVFIQFVTVFLAFSRNRELFPHCHAS